MAIIIETMQKVITKMQSNFYAKPAIQLDQIELRTLVACLCCSILGALCLFVLPELSYAAANGGISEISDLKGLTTNVKTNIQSYGLPIVLNAAGVGISGFALITQRWQYLFFGAAFLIFVNLYFGFVNANFKIA